MLYYNIILYGNEYVFGFIIYFRDISADTGIYVGDYLFSVEYSRPACQPAFVFIDRDAFIILYYYLVEIHVHRASFQQSIGKSHSNTPLKTRRASHYGSPLM